MKGHIFQLLEEFLVETTGEADYQGLLEKCSFETDTGFIRTETYPDAHLLELVGHACEHLGLTVEQAQYAFGKWILPHLVEMLPSGADPYSSPDAFLQHIGDIHEVELKKLYPDAEPPAFVYSKSGDQGILTYFSKRQMFALVEGCLDGVAEQWASPVSYTRVPDDNEFRCHFHIRFD